MRDISEYPSFFSQIPIRQNDIVKPDYQDQASFNYWITIFSIF